MVNRMTRIRIAEDGRLEVVDPGFESLELLRSIDPSFHIQRTELPGFASPRFLRTRKAGCGIATHKLSGKSEDTLWDVHSEAIERLRSGDMLPIRRGNEASMLDLKIELSYRMLSNCRLCAQRCGVDRIRGELGICGLAIEATVANRFIHIAEEPPINPSMLLSLSGCGLRCSYCQQGALLDPGSVAGELLDATIWGKLYTNGARSISFIGGNPDESLYAILRFLATAPSNWKLPVVWNCHAYGTPETIQLLDGVVDVYVPDFKYGSEDCSRQLSAAPGYPKAAKTTLCAMLAQKVPAIVRILVLPGHFVCCHAPVLEFLSTLDEYGLLVSVRDQYYPDWKITLRDGEMVRRPSQEEVEMVHKRAFDLGLLLVD